MGQGRRIGLPLSRAVPGLRAEHHGLPEWEVNGKLCAELCDLSGHFLGTAAHLIMSMHLSNGGYSTPPAKAMAELPTERAPFVGQVCALLLGLKPDQKGRMSRVLGTLLELAGEEEDALHSARLDLGRGGFRLPFAPLNFKLLDHVTDRLDLADFEEEEVFQDDRRRF